MLQPEPGMILSGLQPTRKMAARVVSALLPSLRDSSERIKAATVFAFGYAQEQTVAKLLVELLDDSSIGITRAVACSLGSIGGSEAAEALVALLEHEDRFVLVVAAYSLGKLGDTKAERALLALLDHQEQLVREAAAEALGRIRSPGAVKPLLGLLDKAPGTKVIEALGRIGDPTCVPALLEYLKKGDGWQTQAIRALASLRDPSAVQQLSEMIDHEDHYEKLKTWDGPPDIWAILSLQSQYLNGWRPIQEEVIRALGKIGGRAAIEPLAKASRHSDPWGLSSVAQNGLAAIDDPEAVNLIIRQCACSRAIELFRSASNPGAVPWLIDITKTENDPEIQKAAIRALGEIGDLRALPPLVDTVRDCPDGQVGFAALTALSDLIKYAKKKGNGVAFELASWRERILAATESLKDRLP